LVNIDHFFARGLRIVPSMADTSVTRTHLVISSSESSGNRDNDLIHELVETLKAIAECGSSIGRPAQGFPIEVSILKMRMITKEIDDRMSAGTFRPGCSDYNLPRIHLV
jgi:hypothetical protein